MRSTVFTILLFAAAPAFAQGTTISASLTGDVARFSRTEARPATAVDLSALDGEAIGFNAAVGRAIGERWGVAVEFGRTGKIESRQEVEFDPRLAIWAYPTGVRTIEYDTAPMAAFDAAIKLTDHTAFTAGVRLHGIALQGLSGWLVRPGVGVRWRF